MHVYDLVLSLVLFFFISRRWRHTRCALWIGVLSCALPIFPLLFVEGVDRKTLGLTGEDAFTIPRVAALKPRQTVDVIVTRADGKTETFPALCRIDTANDLEYFLNGGILQYVLRKLAA